MEQRFFQRLSAELQNLVQELEDFAGVEIEVRPKPTPTGETTAKSKAVALISSEKGATLLCRSEDHFTTQAVLHELLHLRRYWIDFVPQLVPIDDRGGDKTKIANEIDNALEHLAIFPQEAEYGFEPYADLNRAARTLWESYPWNEITEPWARRKSCLLAWLTTVCLVTDDAVKTLARDCLEKEGLLDEAENFSDKIRQLHDSKERSIGTAVRFLQIPHDEAEMIYFDVKQKKRVKKPIPPH
ncbi:MAG: hypothetical protein ACE5LB_02750 [Acidiferrobacterales bacterium]